MLHEGNEGCIVAPPCEDRGILTWFRQLYLVARGMLLATEGLPLRSTEPAGRRRLPPQESALRYFDEAENDRGPFNIQKAYLVQACSRMGAMRTLPAQWR